MPPSIKRESLAGVGASDLQIFRCKINGLEEFEGFTLHPSSGII
jgi:hypothetical protein